jgi:glycosyltransferase involved in cell wall biosynthesis
MDPAVSVVIASYNMGCYIGDALASVLSQTMDNFDVHVVDDGSTDNTRKVVAQFSHDRRVHYYWQENAGQARAKNLGIQSSRGTLVAFCDADDLWKPDKLERQCPIFSQTEAVGVVYTRASQIFEDEAEEKANSLVSYYSGKITAELFKCNFIPFGTAVVRRRCLQELGAFDERYRMGIDWELWLRISTRYEFQFLDAVTYVYRVWKGQMSTNWRGRYEHAFRIMTDFLSEHPEMVHAEVIREAWANSFVQRARVRSLRSGEHVSAVLDIARALRLMPGYPLAWWSLARIFLNAVGSGKSTQ